METRSMMRWPREYEPGRTAVQVRNELSMAAAAAAVWAWLVRAELWPSWYPNSHHVRIVDGPRPDLGLGSRFRWRTFGVTIDSRVEELVPGERIAWSAHGVGVRAYHAWVITPGEAGEGKEPGGTGKPGERSERSEPRERGKLARTIEPGQQRGCHVLTEETQNGWVARLGSFLMPGRMHRGHQVWLEELARKAAGGGPAAG